MEGTDSELRDVNSAPEEQQDKQSSSSSSVQNSKDSVWMSMEEFLTNMFLADEEDQGASSSNDQPGQCPFNIPKLLRTKTFDEVFSEMIDYCHSNDQGQQTKNPAASPEASGNMSLENFLARAGIVMDDVHEPPPQQQTRYQKGLKERRRLRMVKNIELAAQFRAKKQAYNIQLEQELYLLKKENKHLKLLMKHGEELARARGSDATQSQ